MGYKTIAWRKSMRVTLDYNNMTSAVLGEKGISPKKLGSYRLRAANVLQVLVNDTSAKEASVYVSNRALLFLAEH